MIKLDWLNDILIRLADLVTNRRGREALQDILNMVCIVPKEGVDAQDVADKVANLKAIWNPKWIQALNYIQQWVRK